ncbi:Piwi domain-containing protein [Powellomyces hirtus]|nr:Piwi domain-containing protein [Powellomyces hirtus]
MVIPGTLPSRPGAGTAGKKVQVTANYWPATTMSIKPVHQYDISIEGQGSKTLPIPVNRKVFEAAVWAAENNKVFTGTGKYIVFDGRKIAWSPMKLDLGTAEAMKATVILPEENGNGAATAPPVTGAEIKMERLKKFVMGELPEGDHAQEAVNVFDAIIRHNASKIKGCEPVGRGYSLYPAPADLTGGAEAWNGLRLSMRAGEKNMFLNADLATTAFVLSGNAIDVVKRILNRQDMSRALTERDCQAIGRLLSKVRIRLAFARQGRKQYGINKVDSTPAQRNMFDHTSGGVTRKISVADYFRETYNIQLKYPHLPCFVCGDVKRPVHLPFEVVEVVPGQAYRRKLDETQTGKMIAIAQQKPVDRLNRTMGGIHSIVGAVREGTTTRDNPYLEAFGVKLAKDPLTITARVLEPPELSYNPKSRQKTIKPMDGTWNLRDKQVCRGMTLHSWSVLVLAPEQRVNRASVDNFVKVLVGACKTHGMEVTMEKPPMRYGTDKNVEEMLKAAYRDAGDGCRTKPQMILVIVPDTNPRRYAEIKRTSDTTLGVITQCMQSKHVGKASMQYCTNLVLKINVKLGGANAYLTGKTDKAPAHLPFITDAPTLVIGMDVTHPGPGEGTSRPSIAAMVGSLDAQCARFAATLRIQRSPQGRQRCDIIQDVFGMTTELLRAFYRSTSRKPNRIIVYRDGASEGQFVEIRQTEIAALNRACAEIEKGYAPPITYIVVTKRHNTRFFPKRREEADKSGNIQPGTVIDTNITLPKEWDFFLNSHAGLLGTSRSAHYHVLHDDNKFTPDRLQNMTYRLCYLYARCTRSVSVCPPIYYADLVAARARAHFQGLEWGEESSPGAAAEHAKMWDTKFAKVKPELGSVMYYM